MLILFILPYSIQAATTYPKVISLTVQSTQNLLTINAQCDSLGEVYYAAYLTQQLRPSFSNILLYTNSQTTPPQWQYFGKQTLTTQSVVIVLQNVRLNSEYSVDLYCYSSAQTLSIPATKDRISTTNNRSKALVLKSYVETNPVSSAQYKEVACKASKIYTKQVSRIVVGNNVLCTDSTSISTTLNLTKTYVQTKPYLASTYFLEDYTSAVQDNFPDELEQQGAQELEQQFFGGTTITLNTSKQATLVDFSKISYLPEIAIKLAFKSKQLISTVQLTNTDGIVVFGITEIGNQIGLEEFFKNVSSKLLVKDISEIKANDTITYTITNMTIGQEYLVQVAGLLYPQADSPNSGMQRYPILASLIKSLDQFQDDKLEEEFDGLTVQKLQTLKRSQLQKRDIHDWLKKRHNEKVKKRYLYFPEEIKQQLEVKKIFKNFDKDNSNNLDMNELYEMFQKNGFKITEDQLQKFFKVVDQDRDNALNWKEFKNSAFNEKAAKVFYQIMKELRQKMEQERQKTQDDKQDTPAKKYMPLTFNSMISYLSYLATRGELEDQINDEQISQLDRFKKYVEMINLTSQMTTQKKQQCVEEERMEVIQDQNESANLDQEQQFVRRTAQRFNQFKSSFYNSQQSVQSSSPPEKQSHSHKGMQKLISQKLPKRIREIDAIVRCHQIPQSQSMFRMKKQNNSQILKLKQDVSRYIQLAKTQYNINIDELARDNSNKQGQQEMNLSNDPTKNINVPKVTIKIRNFEEDFKNTLAQHQATLDDQEPYIKLSQKEHPLPIIDEKLKTTYQDQGDHLPYSLLNELKKYQRTQSNQQNTRTTLFKTQSDFIKTATSHKAKFIFCKQQSVDKLIYNSMPHTAKSRIDTSNGKYQQQQIRMGSNYGSQRIQFQKTFVEIQPILGKSLIK